MAAAKSQRRRQASGHVPSNDIVPSTWLAIGYASPIFTHGQRKPANLVERGASHAVPKNLRSDLYAGPAGPGHARVGTGRRATDLQQFLPEVPRRRGLRGRTGPSD